MPTSRSTALGIATAFLGILWSCAALLPYAPEGSMVTFAGWSLLLLFTFLLTNLEKAQLMVVMVAFWSASQVWLWISPLAATPSLIFALAATVLTGQKATFSSAILLTAGVAIVGFSGEAGSSGRLRELLEMLGLSGPILDDLGFYIRKTAHFLVYGTIAVAACRSLRGLDVRRRYLMALIVAATLGAIDELAQGLVETRTSSVYDWLLDMAGASTSLALLRRWERKNED